MSLHNLNTPNKQWLMYLNTLSSISGDDLTIKPDTRRNLLLEVSGNNNIIMKKGTTSYNLTNFITGDVSFSNLDVSVNIIPLNTSMSYLGSLSKQWRNIYANDLIINTINGQAYSAGGAKRFYNQDWNLLGTNITTLNNFPDARGLCLLSVSLDGYTIMILAYSNTPLPTGVGSQVQLRYYVAVYTFTSNSWVQKGDTFVMPFTYVPPWRYAENGGGYGDGTSIYNSSHVGSRKFMSDDGNTIAIAISQGGFGANTGQYLDNIYTDSIYSFNGTAWILIASQTTQTTIARVRHFVNFSFKNNIIKRFIIGGGDNGESVTNVIISTLTNGTFVQDSA